MACYTATSDALCCYHTEAGGQEAPRKVSTDCSNMEDSCFLSTGDEMAPRALGLADSAAVTCGPRGGMQCVLSPPLQTKVRSLE